MSNWTRNVQTFKEEFKTDKGGLNMSCMTERPCEHGVLKSWDVFGGHDPDIFKHECDKEIKKEGKNMKNDVKEFTLADTLKLMNSKDYKERFIGEYLQTKCRYIKLHNMIIKSEANILNFKLSTPLEILIKQKSAMGQYLHMLEVRAEIEGVDLPILIFVNNRFLIF